MYEFHTTKDGNKLMICMMDDKHLVNTIKAHLAKIKRSSEILEGKMIDSINPVMSVLQPQISHENLTKQARETVKYCHNALQPYIMEACLRGITPEFTNEMQLAYRRKTQVFQGPLLEGDSDDGEDNEPSEKAYSYELHKRLRREHQSYSSDDQ